MADSPSSPNSTVTENTQPISVPANPLSCFSGAFVSGSLALLLYRLTSAIATAFAHKPVTSDNLTVINITVAVRTLVVGMVALGTGIFGLAALGLTALGIQIIIQRLMGKRSSAEDR
ncbi:MAG: DUF3082 domain-containing protein [Pseudanabaenales cyanobacterium]|nr:DUF3082 domain-containing protein [Pseudanabaenales cyanobacterium]